MRVRPGRRPELDFSGAVPGVAAGTARILVVFGCSGGGARDRIRPGCRGRGLRYTAQGPQVRPHPGDVGQAVRPGAGEPDRVPAGRWFAARVPDRVLVLVV